MSAALTSLAADNPLDRVSMGPRQILVLVIALWLAALDGYDALSMTFVAPALATEWGIGKSVIGLLLSSSLVGMAIGAIALSPLADKLGRRTVILGAIAVMTLGTTLSGLAGSIAALLLFALVLAAIGLVASGNRLVRSGCRRARLLPRRDHGHDVHDSGE